MKKLIFIVFIIVIALIVGYNYIYQDHRNIQEEQAMFTVTAVMLSNEFSIDPSTSEKKYLNQTIKVSGMVSAQSENAITLNNNIFCQFSNSNAIELKNNAPIKIKGRVIGYDDLLEEIKLDQCIIIN